MLKQTDLCSYMVAKEVLELEQRTVIHVPNGDPGSCKEAVIMPKETLLKERKNEYIS